MSQTLSLYRLQQIDSQIDRARARLQAVAGLLENDQDLRAANEQAQEAEAAHQAAERALHKAEAEVEAQRIKIEQTEASLYGGSVHSPKELQDLQNDVAALKRHLATLEDRQLDAMLVAEAAEASNRSAVEKAEQVREHLMEQNQDLRQEQESLQKEIERLNTEHGAVVGNIPQEAISFYDRLRQERRGVAVATISENSCEACGSTLTLAHVQLAHSSGEIAICPSCGRILYGS
jgi:predicted  nucleic acid-binding Zn-ribbon protein